MAQRYYPLDALTKFGEDVTLTATGNFQIGGNDVVLKIGKGRQDMALVVDVSALYVAGADELYDILLQGCSVSTFSGQPIENLAHLELGHTTVRTGGARTLPIGRYAIPVSNDLLGEFEYVRLRLVAAGATKSITCTAWLSERL
ncbi:MAG: hypothetical protein J0I67_07050 [Bosea sp.]|jgi:hypothetical protein|nr:hypothetical protein [Bosea sp. (in: a-proteobacteria)]